MRGNKLVKRGRIGVKIGDEEIKNKLENEFGSKVEAIKRNKKNIIVIIKWVPDSWIYKLLCKNFNFYAFRPNQ